MNGVEDFNDFAVGPGTSTPSQGHTAILEEYERSPDAVAGNDVEAELARRVISHLCAAATSPSKLKRNLFTPVYF